MVSMTGLKRVMPLKYSTDGGNCFLKAVTVGMELLRANPLYREHITTFRHMISWEMKFPS
jgi:hypothetical protein